MDKLKYDELRVLWDMYHADKPESGDDTYYQFKFYLFSIYVAGLYGIYDKHITFYDWHSYDDEVIFFDEDVWFDSDSIKDEPYATIWKIISEPSLYLSMIYIIEYVELHTTHSIDHIPVYALRQLGERLYTFCQRQSVDDDLLFERYFNEYSNTMLHSLF